MVTVGSWQLLRSVSTRAGCKAPASFLTSSSVGVVGAVSCARAGDGLSNSQSVAISPKDTAAAISRRKAHFPRTHLGVRCFCKSPGVRVVIVVTPNRSIPGLFSCMRFMLS